MPAKQCLRLITTPDLVCPRILKAKYYPNISMICYNLPLRKVHHSRCHNIFMFGLSSFKRGYIWRIGRGERIQSSSHGKVITPEVNQHLAILLLIGLWDDERIGIISLAKKGEERRRLLFWACI